MELSWLGCEVSLQFKYKLLIWAISTPIFHKVRFISPAKSWKSNLSWPSRLRPYAMETGISRGSFFPLTADTWHSIPLPKHQHFCHLGCSSTAQLDSSCHLRGARISRTSHVTSASLTLLSQHPTALQKPFHWSSQIIPQRGNSACVLRHLI